MLVVGLFGAAPIILNQSTWRDVIKPDMPKPMLLLISSLVCPHCAEMKPDWRLLQERYQNETRFVFGEVDCHLEKLVCKDLPGKSTTPNMFWIVEGDLDNAIKFEDSFQFDPMVSFVEKRLAPSVHELSEAAFHILQSQQPRVSFFVARGNVSLDNVSRLFAASPAVFVHIATGADSLAVTCQATGENVVCPSLAPETIQAFVEEYLFPRVSTVTSFWKKRFMKRGRVAFTTFTNLSLDWSKLPADLRLGVVECRKEAKLCRDLGWGLRRGGFALWLGKGRWYGFTGYPRPWRLKWWLWLALHGLAWPEGEGVFWRQFAIIVFGTVVTLVPVLAISFWLCFRCCAPRAAQREEEKGEEKQEEAHEKED